MRPLRVSRAIASLSTETFPRNQNSCARYEPSSLFERCSSLKQAKQIHAHFISLGLLRYTYIVSRILALYALREPDMLHARRLFDGIRHPTIFNWNTMIRGYSGSPRPGSGLDVYLLMRRQGIAPNMHTFPFVVKSCGCLLSLCQVHARVFGLGFDRDVFVSSSLVKQYSSLGAMELASQVFDESSNRNIVCWTSLISGYCSRGLVDKARRVFNAMPEKNDVSWSAMLTGYVQNERYEEAIQLFRWLRSSKLVELNDSLLVSVLKACSGLGAFEDGRLIHLYIDGKRLDYGLELGTALVDFYSKCGFIEVAMEVFDKISPKDVMAWSAMIVGLGLNGHTQSAIEVFFEMLSQKVLPNAITFIGLLTACNHGGLVEEGQGYFNEMKMIYGVPPTIEHYGCMVDLLSRAGHIAEAMDLIGSMPMEPDGAIWGAVLNGCLMHGHAEVGERVGKHVTELEPGHCGRYVSLANVYAAMGRWDGVIKVRRTMRGNGVRTTAGWSLIEVNGVGQRFIADDKFHSRHNEICKMLHDLNLELVSSSHEINLDEIS